MCGIVGILGKKPVAPLIVDALKRLEYRGYDSAGVATVEGGKLDRLRAKGKLVNLEQRLDENPLSGTIGIGHTRWATHGAPTEENAHPHFSSNVAVVHNGIIENFKPLREELTEAGFSFASQTDTEVIAHMVCHGINQGLSPEKAVHECVKKLEGAFALAILFREHDDLMFGARNGPPLAIGHGEGELFLGSDAIALSPFTNKITYLDDGDWCKLERDGYTVYDIDGNEVSRETQTSVGASLMVDKGNYRHFMQKEIFEQPEVISHALVHYLDFAEGKVRDIEGQPFDFSDFERLSITACGTASYAGQVAKYWFERYARLPVDIDVASEFRYREIPLSPNGLALVISQSGETADTLASLRYCKQEGQKIGAIVNAKDSTIARESDAIFPILAGPEIGVASTKAFTCQLSVLAALAIQAGRKRGKLSQEQEEQLVQELSETPRLASEVLKLEEQIDNLARDLSHYKHVLFLGRDTNYPLAMEGALKLKETSYIHAEAYAAGELKHGPIALIDEEMPVVVIAPYDHIFEKTVSNMQEVAARGGKIILITDERGAKEAAMDGAQIIIMPDMPQIITPILYAIPLQLLSYYAALHLGTDVDQPRNLAKSVTVE
jgi:glucosamine--fructose-6-phosphate aminotransferase (isomerizing)